MTFKNAIKWLIGIEEEIKKEDEKMELKVWDKVLLKSLDECRKTRAWVSGMDAFAGKVVSVAGCNNHLKVFVIEDCLYHFGYDAIEKKIDADPVPTPKDDFELLFGFTD